MALELNNENFDSEISSGAALVDFWAPWCNPCKMVAPIIDKLASEYEGKAKICKVNVDEQGELSKRFGIRNIPTILLLKDGEIKDQITGAMPEQTIREKLQAIL